MPRSGLKRQLSLYRSILVALANAGVTWVVLIIAPLGLFAVITCTVLVFVSTLVTEAVGNWALTALLRAAQQDLLASETAYLEDPYPPSQSYRNPQLPRQSTPKKRLEE